MLDLDAIRHNWRPCAKRGMDRRDDEAGCIGCLIGALCDEVEKLRAEVDQLKEKERKG